MNTLRGVFVLLVLVANTLVGCVPLYVIGLVRLVSPRRFRSPLGRAMDRIVQTWVRGHRLLFSVLGITRLNVRWAAGPRLSTDAWYLVISNHQSWADIVILQNVLVDAIPTLKFFTKRQLVWVPLIGVAMWFLDFPYVRRLPRERIAADPSLAELDRQATLDACRVFRDHPTSVLAFLEGTRFTAAKHAAQDPARFHNLLNPKLGGASYVVSTLADRIHGVLDVTLVYPEGVPTFWELLKGECPRVDVLIEPRLLPDDVLEAADPDAVRELLRPWVENVWQIKDRRLEGLEQAN